MRAKTKSQEELAAERDRLERDCEELAEKFKQHSIEAFKDGDMELAKLFKEVERIFKPTKKKSKAFGPEKFDKEKARKRMLQKFAIDNQKSIELYNEKMKNKRGDKI